MPTPDITGGARIALKMSQHGQERVNVWHATKPTDWTLTQLQDLATNILTNWQTTWRGNEPDDLCVIDVVCTSLMGADSIQATLPCTANCCGTRTVSPAPGNASSTISWRTSGIGRRKRGRTYPAGMVDEDINDDDTITSTRIVNLSQMAIAIMNAVFLVATANLGVFSRVALVISPVVSYVIENILDTQRKRLPGRGN